MNRLYFIDDAAGKRQLDGTALPLRVGGRQLGGIVLYDAEPDALLAYLAVSEGHAYIQVAGDRVAVFHNDERLAESNWLKSGDRVRFGDEVLSWRVEGDRVLIEVSRDDERPVLRPPSRPPAGPSPTNNDLPVHTDRHETVPQRGWPLRAVTIGLSLLALAAIGLLVTVPVKLQVEPAADAVVMDGTLPTLALGDSRLALPGEYTVSATRAGYLPLQEVITVSRGGNDTFTFQLVEKPGILHLVTQPDMPLEIRIDGQLLVAEEDGGYALPRGEHRLDIRADRFLPHAEHVDIRGRGEHQELSVTLEPAWALVSVSSDPTGSDVHVDGQHMGVTPLEMELLQGDHELLFQQAGFQDRVIQQTVTAGQPVVLETVELLPVKGTLTVDSTPAGATLAVNGRFVGTTPITVDLASEVDHRLKLAHAGHDTRETSVTLAPGEEKQIKLSLPPQLGIVFFTVTPPDAELRIGDRVYTGAQRLELEVRPQSIQVDRPGYAAQTVTVTPQAGISQNIEIRLVKSSAAEEQEADESPSVSVAVPATLTTAVGQELVLVRPDDILIMGASRREAGRRANENRRQVRLNRPFYFARAEVTNAQFREFRAEHESARTDGARLNGEKQPVVNVSWEDAARYCNWLSKKEGLPEFYEDSGDTMAVIQPLNIGYRLPTEAEWAWVARRQDQESEQRYPWQGSYPPAGDAGNYADTQIADTLADTVPGYNDGHRGTAPIASFAPWPAGFYDLGGNVAEWMHDYYAVYPGEAERIVTDPRGPDTGDHRVVRGASWRHGNITELRLSYRDYSNKPRPDLGFRIARYAE